MTVALVLFGVAFGGLVVFGVVAAIDQKARALATDEAERDVAEDVVRIRSHALVGNVTSEVARAQVACAAGLPADALRQRLEPPHTVTAPVGLDPCAVTPAVLNDYVLGTNDEEIQRLRRWVSHRIVLVSA